MTSPSTTSGSDPIPTDSSEPLRPMDTAKGLPVIFRTRASPNTCCRAVGVISVGASRLGLAHLGEDVTISVQTKPPDGAREAQLLVAFS